MNIGNPIVNLIISSRHFYEQSAQNINIGASHSLIVASSLLQDSIEMLLYASALHLQLNTESKFDALVSSVEKALDPRNLPYRSYLTRINKMRVASKHHGVIPDKNQLLEFSITTKAFLGESCELIFGVNFWLLSAIDLIRNETTKKCIKDAQDALNNGDAYKCLVEIGKSIYTQFYSHFDVDLHAYCDNSGHIFGMRGSFLGPDNALSHLMSESFSADQLSRIVIDQMQLDYIIDSSGVNRATFIRTTSAAPLTKLDRRTGKWIVRWPVGYSGKQSIRRIAEEALADATEIAIAVSEGKNINFPKKGMAIGTIKKINTYVYRSASLKSRVVRMLGQKESAVVLEYLVPNTDEGVDFWKIQPPLNASTYYEVGYICANDIESHLEMPPTVYD